MKMIIAMIQPHSFPSVKKELLKNEITKMSITNILGCGQQKGYSETYRGAIAEVNLLKKIRLEIAVNDQYVEKAISAIISGAKTGKIGDGKIFVTPIEDCIRIRTEEKGPDAVG